MFYKYIFSTAGLNGLYGIYKTYNPDVLRDNKIVNKMLFSEKIPIVIFHIITGPYIFPCRIIDVMTFLEIKNRNDDFKNYGYNLENKPKRLLEYYS